MKRVMNPIFWCWVIVGLYVLPLVCYASAHLLGKSTTVVRPELVGNEILFLPDTPRWVDVTQQYLGYITIAGSICFPFALVAMIVVLYQAKRKKDVPDHSNQPTS